MHVFKCFVLFSKVVAGVGVLKEVRYQSVDGPSLENLKTAVYHAHAFGSCKWRKVHPL